MNLHIIILAAGKGVRMNSSLPKALQPLAGMTLLEHVINTAQKLNPEKIHIVYGSGKEKLLTRFSHLPFNFVLQEEQLGTGHAVLKAMPYIEDNAKVLILFCDAPLISVDTLQSILEVTESADLGIISADVANPFGFGRIVRDAKQNVIGIVEEKDATKEEQKIIEISSGILCLRKNYLQKYLQKIKPENSQKEYYLTDIVKMMKEDNLYITAIKARDSREVLGVNDKVQLAFVERIYQNKIAENLMKQGLTLLDPNRFDVRGELIVGRDVVIDVNVVIEGKVTIGDNTKIGPNCFLKNVEIKNNVEIRANCVIENAVLDDDSIIGPFSRIRPESYIGKKAHIGNFVEIKKSKIAEGSKINHLAYVGDASVGKNVNVSAGVITCNYDGANKYQTIIEDGAFIGSDSQLIAPVKIGKNAYIGSGSTITKDAPADKLTIARAKEQVTVENWEKPVKDKNADK